MSGMNTDVTIPTPPTEYMVFNGKKYYYNSCPCGIEEPTNPGYDS